MDIPEQNLGRASIFSNARPQGAGSIGDGWAIYRIVTGVETEPTPADYGKMHLKSGRSADMAWATVVIDNNNNGAKVAGRTFAVSFGRFATGSGAPKIPNDFIIPLTEEVVSLPVLTRPDLAYLQPTLADPLFAYVSNWGTIGAGEVVYLLYKHTNRQS